MAKSSHRPAGGLKSRNVVNKPVRTGAANKAVRPGYAGQIGSSVGTHITGRRNETDYRGVGMKGGAALPSTLGNTLAQKTVCGVGGSRTIHKTGSQQGLVTRANNPRGRDFDV